MEILIQIYQDPLLAHCLYFKGGTAFYLFYDFPRFSTDLDFDLSQSCQEKEKVFEHIKKILSGFGTLRESIIKRSTFFFLLSYEKYQKTIKVEISTRSYGAEEYEIKNIFGVDIKLLKLDYLCAHKLVALSERIKARDLFDAYFILLNDLPINNEIIKIRTDKNIKNFFKSLYHKVQQSFTRKNVLHELGELIDENKKNWTREKLIDETLTLIKKKL